MASLDNESSLVLVEGLIRRGYGLEFFDLRIVPDHDNRTVILNPLKDPQIPSDRLIATRTRAVRP